MTRVLVSGVSWYVTATNDAYVLPSETVVTLTGLLEAFTSGRIAHLLLPEGTLALPRRALPLEPVPMDRVFPLGAAAVEWKPDPERWHIGSGVPVLSPHWHRLFAERSAFTAWASAGEDAAALADFLRRFGPRPTFRESYNRKELLFKYPQLVDPALCYRLGPGFAQLPDPARFDPVVAVQERLRLVDLEQGTVVTFGPGEFGWVARAFADAGAAGIGKAADSATPRSVEELERFLAARGRYWRLEPARREANLVLPGQA
ncbi:MAG TPA: hypothetical protein VIL95_01650 [Bacillota bacterium]